MNHFDQIKGIEQRRNQEYKRQMEVSLMKKMISEEEKEKKKEKTLTRRMAKVDQFFISEKDLMDFKSKVMKIDVSQIPMHNQVERIKAEINNLEVHDIHLQAQMERLEDKLSLFIKLYNENSKTLENAHVEALEKEEVDYTALQIENKRNDLLSSRNYVKEMQQIGWLHLPPKVADECSKTQIELDYFYQVNGTIKNDINEEMILLNKINDELQISQEKYADLQILNNTLEEDIDIVVEEINRLSNGLDSKENLAKDLEDAVFGLKSEIEAAHIAREKLLVENKEKMEQEALEQEEKLKLRNKEIEDLKEEYEELTQKAKEAEEQVTNMQKALREQNEIIKMAASKNINLDDLHANLNEIKKSCDVIVKQTGKESKQKNIYYEILEEMLGNLMILCRCGNSKLTNLKFINDSTLLVKPGKIKYEFNHVFDSKCKTEDLFDKIEHFYDRLIDGYNCYIVTMGEKGSGKTYNILGDANNGLLFQGLKKIRDKIRVNTKNHLTSRMFVCAMEILDSKLYDLIQNKIIKNFKVKKDFFKMTLIKGVQYSECLTVDEVLNCFMKAINNRPNAFKELESNDTNFVAIMTIQVSDKNQHRHCKGKMTHVKLASSKNNTILIDELKKVTQGSTMNFRATLMTELLRDCFGGSAKTCVIGCVNQGEHDEKDTLTTIKLVSSLKSITNEIARNMDTDELFRMKNNIERLLRGAKEEYV